MAEYRAIETVANGALTHVITHNLGNVDAVLSACTPGGWFGRPRISARDANTITLELANQVPVSGAYTMDVEVKG